jgi:hypothetical protein
MAERDPDDALPEVNAPAEESLADGSETDDGVLSPGSTATGAGTTEADVSDGREQKQPRID